MERRVEELEAEVARLRAACEARDSERNVSTLRGFWEHTCCYCYAPDGEPHEHDCPILTHPVEAPCNNETRAEEEDASGLLHGRCHTEGPFRPAKAVRVRKEKS